MDRCHIVDCVEPAAYIEWFPAFGACVQVCKTHAFDTLTDEAVLDVERITADHKLNVELMHRTRKQ